MIRLYLLGQKGLSILKGLEKSYFSYISEVVIGKDTGVINDYSENILSFCIQNNLTCYAKNQAIENFECKFSIAIGWRWIIDSNNPIIVIHDSILPRLRGFNPLVTALINGDTEIGATALIAKEGYDEGEIIIQKTIKINYPIKIEAAIEKLSSLYVDMVNILFHLIINQKLNSQVQDHSKATYSLWRDEDDYRINWSWSSEKIKRFIDAVGYPYKGAFTTLKGEKLRILDAKVVSDLTIENRTPGKVIFKNNDTYTIVCGTGLILINDFFDDSISKKIQLNNFRLLFE